MKALQQNTQEWLEFRRNKIGSSDAPIIMNQSPWKTPLQLWEEKLSIKNHSYETNAMQRGKDLETEARNKFQKQTGIIVWPDVLTHPEYDFIIASMDGINIDGKVAVEIKCPGIKTFEMAQNGEIPNHYNIQMQHQMAVAQLETIHYFCYDGNEGILLEVKRDNALIEQIIEKELAFYQCMRELKAPIEERADPEWVQYANEWKELQKQKKLIEQQEQHCRQALIELANNESTSGAGIKLTPYTRKGRIAYDKIPELKQIDLEKYREDPINLWKITITNNDKI